MALLNSRDSNHDWAVACFSTMRPPLLTCEAVLSEADHLLERAGGSGKHLLPLLERGVLEIGISVVRELSSIARLKTAYAEVPISIADACLVRIAELSEDSAVWTIDRHFRIYRKNRRHIIPLIAPEGI